jgi:hypothetical protein
VDIDCAASSLTGGLLDSGSVRLVPVTRTRLSVHYETGDAALPVLSVVAPGAVRLPGSIVTGVLPEEGGLTVRDGTLRQGGRVWRVTRWWRPARPSSLRPPPGRTRISWPDLSVPPPRPSYDGLVPAELVGAGPGLTPAGDDVLAGALVTAYATDDPRLPRWGDATREALRLRATTAVSRALLHHALEGYAVDELAGFLTALCGGAGLTRARARLLAVGHSSGAALMAGVLHTLARTERREVA